MSVTDFVPPSAMVVVAHPDDAEFMCAGTIAKWTAAGCRVVYVVITKGDKGSDDPEMTTERLARVREAEQRAAGAILGVQAFEFLGYPDGYLQPTLELRRDLARVIRRHRPHTVITFDPTNRFFSDTYVNHPDHRAAGDAALDAVFPTARDRLTFPELLVDGYEPWKVRQVWLAPAAQPNTWVDISATLEQKKQALLAHPSQLGPEVVEFAESMARVAGAAHGLEAAEAFRRIILEADPVHEGAAYPG
ncbi:PIG-L deacetylase family protein [Tepidiforma sp.]|uniref:PIG-L deacetylase family protein n=1 Tax=Tepidiforma sp. TaxID=2682230 RepID=UPI002ADD8572|nr:PIG-L deacetylase family protein [Tepidiforma sp.]